MLKDRDIPLAFVASTIALLIFAFAWTAPWPELCPQQNQQSSYAHYSKSDNGLVTGATSNPSANSADNQCDEHAITDWWMIRVGLLTLVVLAGQLLMFWRQLNAMQAGVKDAGVAAQAALANATAALSTVEIARHAERAYVKVSPAEPGVKWDGPQSGGFTMAFRVKNFGDTPANVTDVISNTLVPPKDMIFDELPPNIRHDFPKESKAFLVRGDEFYQHPHSEIDDAERAEVEAGDKLFIVYGYVDYIDQFGVRHRGGFGRQYLPNATTNNLIFPDTGPFNYDRARKPGEGIDWN